MEGYFPQKEGPLNGLSVNNRGCIILDENIYLNELNLSEIVSNTFSHIGNLVIYYFRADFTNGETPLLPQNVRLKRIPFELGGWNR